MLLFRAGYLSFRGNEFEDGLARHWLQAKQTAPASGLDSGLLLMVYTASHSLVYTADPVLL